MQDSYLKVLRINFEVLRLVKSRVVPYNLSMVLQNVVIESDLVIPLDW